MTRLIQDLARPGTTPLPGPEHRGRGRQVRYDYLPPPFE